MEQHKVADAYNERYADAGLSDADAMYRWALNKLRPAQGASLLDVACGEGKTLVFAQEQGLDAIGVDLSRAALHISARNAPDAPLAEVNGEALPFADDTFDHVTNLGSLEHYLDPWTGIREIRRVLKPSGTAGILFPNGYYLADILWHVLVHGRGPNHHQVIQRFATRVEWQALLEMMGLEVVRTHRYDLAWPRSRADWAWYRAHPGHILYKLSGLVTPRNLAYSFYYVCKVGEPRPELNAQLPQALRRP